MFELLFREMHTKFRNHTVEVIRRLENRTDKNEKIELFMQKNAERFYKDPRGCVRFVFYFGIVFGWLLSENRNQEIEDIFNTSSSLIRKENKVEEKIQ